MPTTKLLFSLLLLIAAASTTVSARPGIPFHPCNTLIISTSFSVNPNPNFIIMDLRPLRLPRHSHHLLTRRFSDNFLADKIPLPRLSEFTDLPIGFKDRRGVSSRPEEMTDLPFGFSSMRERTKDILSVVASLLFGAACGALTAGTMYLIWSILNSRHGSDYRSVEGFSSDDDDDIFNPKKSHYVVIPSAAEPVKEEKNVVDSAPVVKENV